MIDTMLARCEAMIQKILKNDEKGVRIATFGDSFWKRKGDDGGKM